MSEHDEICRVQEAVVPQLLAQPGVTGVGVGLREKGGQPTDEIVIRVYVARKRTASEVPAAELIPSEIGGFATDVIEKGPDEHCGFFDDYRQRPIGSGLAIERYKSNLTTERGTIGCFVARRLTETERNGLRTQPGSGIIRRVFLLSASHVLNLPDALDRVVHQPHAIDRVAATDPSLGVYAGAVDAGLAPLDDGTDWMNTIVNIGPIAGVRRVRFYENVYKWGTTTGLTGGKANDINYCGNFPATGATFGPGFAVRHNLLREPPFGMQGDSGSLVYAFDEAPNGVKMIMAVGLLVFVTADYTIMCHLDTVLDTLNVELVELAGPFAKGLICTVATPDGRIVSV